MEEMGWLTGTDNIYLFLPLHSYKLISMDFYWFNFLTSKMTMSLQKQYRTKPSASGNQTRDPCVRES
jgi:hypothetical protein